MARSSSPVGASTHGTGVGDAAAVASRLGVVARRYGRCGRSRSHRPRCESVASGDAAGVAASHVGLVPSSCREDAGAERTLKTASSSVPSDRENGSGRAESTRRVRVDGGSATK